MELNESDGMTEAHRTPTVAAKRDSKAVMGGSIAFACRMDCLTTNIFMHSSSRGRKCWICHSSVPWLQGHAIVRHYLCKMRRTFEANMLYLKTLRVGGRPAWTIDDKDIGNDLSPPRYCDWPSPSIEGLLQSGQGKWLTHILLGFGCEPAWCMWFFIVSHSIVLDRYISRISSLYSPSVCTLPRSYFNIFVHFSTWAVACVIWICLFWKSPVSEVATVILDLNVDRWHNELFRSSVSWETRVQNWQCIPPQQEFE